MHTPSIYAPSIDLCRIAENDGVISWHVVLHNNPRGVHFFSADGANNSARNSRLAKYYTNQPSILPRQARDKRKETINSIETQNAGLEWELQQKLDAKGNPQPPHFFDEHIHQIDGSVATVQRRERCGPQKDVFCAMPFSF